MSKKIAFRCFTTLSSTKECLGPMKIYTCSFENMSFPPVGGNNKESKTNATVLPSTLKKAARYRACCHSRKTRGKSHLQPPLSVRFLPWSKHGSPAQPPRLFQCPPASYLVWQCKPTGLGSNSFQLTRKCCRAPGAEACQ